MTSPFWTLEPSLTLSSASRPGILAETAAFVRATTYPFATTTTLPLPFAAPICGDNNSLHRDRRPSPPHDHDRRDDQHRRGSKPQDTTQRPLDRRRWVVAIDPKLRKVGGGRSAHAPAGSGGGLRRMPPLVRAWAFSLSAASPLSVRSRGGGGTYGGSGRPATTISTCSRSSVSRSSNAVASRSRAARRSLRMRVASA